MKILILLMSMLVSTCAIAQQTTDSSFKPFAQQIPGSSLTYSLIPIAGGSFIMGSPAGEKNRRPDEGPAKKINVSPFWIGAFEVTHDQFGIFYTDESISQGSRTDAVTRPTAQYIDLSWNMGKEGGFPVNSMSVDGAMMFCKWLYDKTGIFYRLPTEAEWEYACRAGTTTTYYFGDDPSRINDYAWSKLNSQNKYQKVGQKKPNAWGLYDMIGNVSEWVLDQYSDKYFDTVTVNDPLVTPLTRYPRSIRGGSYADDAVTLRSAARRFSVPEWNKRDPQIPKSRWWLTEGKFVGFRIVRPLKQPTKEEAENFYNLYLSN